MMWYDPAAMADEPIKNLWLRRELPLLLAILAIGAGLRIARIGFDGLTIDDIWHLELSTGRGSPHVRLPADSVLDDAPAVTSLKGAPPFYAIWTHMDFVVHPPLYCTLLRFWRDLFGQGDTAARAFSIVCWLVAIALMFMVGREMNGPVPAFWAAAIFAVAPTQVLLAQQVRAYGLMCALGMGALLALVRLEKSSRDNWSAAIALGLCVLGMMLSHYFAIGAAAAIGAYVLRRLRGQRLRMAIAALVGAAVIFLIAWGPFLWEQRIYFAKTADVWLVENSPNHLRFTFGRAASWCWWLVARTDQTPLPLLSVVLLVIPGIMLHRRPDLLIWYLWLGGTLGFVAALDILRDTSHLRYERYVSLAAPAVFMLFTAILTRLPGWLRHGLPLAVVLTALILSQHAYVHEEADEPDWRELGQIIDTRVAPGETLVFYPGILPVWYNETFYLTAAHYSHAFPRTIVKLTHEASDDLVRQIPGQTVWLICGRPPHGLDTVLPGAVQMDSPLFVSPAIACIHMRLNGPRMAER